MPDIDSEINEDDKVLEAVEMINIFLADVVMNDNTERFLKSLKSYYDRYGTLTDRQVESVHEVDASFNEKGSEEDYRREW